MINKTILPPLFIHEDGYGNVTTREEMCSLIDRWKSLLVSKGARRGNSLGISLVFVTPNHIALIFAAGELGLKLVLLDKPVCEETIPATKAALFAPIDFHVCDEFLFNSPDFPYYRPMLERYCVTNIMEDEINSHFDEVSEIYGTSDDLYLCGSTSGTSSKGTIVEFTQKDCYDLALRNTDVFGFTENSIVCQTRNMHHVSCMLTFMLPSLLVASKHYYYNIYREQEKFFEFVRDKKIDQVFFGSHYIVEDMIKTDVVFDVAPKINVSGYTVPEEYITYCKKHNVEFMSHYGSVDTGIPLLLNHVTKDSEYIPNWLGREPDGYYELMWWPETARTAVYSWVWGSKPREIQDYISPRSDGMWCHFGRLEKNVTEEVLRNVTCKDLTVIDDHIVFWEECDFPTSRYHVHYLDKKTWTTETKINLHQLRYYLKNTA